MRLNLSRFFSGFNSIYLTQPLFNAAFYGLKSIFVLYVVAQLSLTEGQAISLFAAFMALCYGTSLIGGYIADHGLGVKNAVILGGVLTGLGLLCILFPSPDSCFLGLALVSLGSGFFKPNLLTAVGLIFENPKDPQKDRAYSIIYIGGNVGTLIVPALCGFVGKIYGWHYAILLVVAIFISATYLFYKKMRFHSSYKPQAVALSQARLWGIILSLVGIFWLLFKYRETFHGMMGVIACANLVYLGRIIYQCRDQERKDVFTVISYILLFALFVALFEQSGSSLLLFFEKAVDRNVMGVVLPSSTLISLNSLAVLMCGPILLYASRHLEKTRPIGGFTKTGCGFLLVALSFWILALGTYRDTGAFIPFLWVAGAIFVQTLGELWVAPISMSKISQHAPPHLQSVMMSFWPMAVAYGHYFAGFIAQFSVGTPTTPALSHEHYRSFFFYLGLMTLVIGVLVLLFQWLKPRAFGGKRSA